MKRGGFVVAVSFAWALGMVPACGGESIVIWGDPQSNDSGGGPATGGAAPTGGTNLETGGSTAGTVTGGAPATGGVGVGGCTSVGGTSTQNGGSVFGGGTAPFGGAAGLGAAAGEGAGVGATGARGHREWLSIRIPPSPTKAARAIGSRVRTRRHLGIHLLEHEYYGSLRNPRV